ncbi:MAG: type II toxin-antitoxin system prevent-host-death family antitoxin [Nitrospira sp.]|nr:type II toxin-antitoxin system prevent-host-death family antitoxin [Nitrospira sp.]MDE0404937.1 type II toxin-antitoxin system prevent-host-death family antitoxin [Nitrospira sp.]MDE0486274.1 type II toxin-antitoxin system prevent-host-death family antitoxin [Nitrospira sp.]
MEFALRQAKARLSELVAAAQGGERVVITKHGQPAVELVRFSKPGGIDFDKLNEARHRLSIKDDEKAWPEQFDDPAFSRKVLGLE